MTWIHVADLDKALERVVAHGGAIVDPPSPDGTTRALAMILDPPSPDGTTRALATILDPEGNPVGLVSHSSPH